MPFRRKARIAPSKRRKPQPIRHTEASPTAPQSKRPEEHKGPKKKDPRNKNPKDKRSDRVAWTGSISKGQGRSRWIAGRVEPRDLRGLGLCKEARTNHHDAAGHKRRAGRGVAPSRPFAPCFDLPASTQAWAGLGVLQHLASSPQAFLLRPKPSFFAPSLPSSPQAFPLRPKPSLFAPSLPSSPQAFAARRSPCQQAEPRLTTAPALFSGPPNAPCSLRCRRRPVHPPDRSA